METKQQKRTSCERQAISNSFLPRRVLSACVRVGVKDSQREREERGKSDERERRLFSSRKLWYHQQNRAQLGSFPLSSSNKSCMFALTSA